MIANPPPPAPFTIPPRAADLPVGLPDDQPLTVAWASAALSKLCALGLPALCDWLMADPSRCDRPPVEEMIRDVLDVTDDEMGYRYADGVSLPRDVARRDATRTELLLLWASDPRYADPDEGPGVTYCEGCEVEGRPLTAAGYCPVCAEIACARGDGDRVGLPVPPDVEAAIGALDDHTTACDESDVAPDDCPVCVFASHTCPECDTASDELDPDDVDAHEFLGEWVVVGCEGYVSAIVRAAWAARAAAA